VQAIEKYMHGLETRVAKLDATAANNEFNKVVKAIIFSVEADAAECRAQELLNE
jgi:hypothetical protein